MKIFQRIWMQSRISLPILLLLSVLLRLPSLFPPVIDHDESTYLIMASGLLDGDLLYSKHIDVKPPGIFLIFAFALSVWKHVMAVRILAALCIGLSAWFLFLSVQTFWRAERKYAFLAGVLYIIASSLHRWEWSANTEIFFNLFTTAALWTLLTYKNLKAEFFFSLLMGLGFLVKYHVIFDFTALWFVLRGIPLLRQNFFAFFRSGLLSLSVFLLPFGLTVFYYFLLGEWELFRYVSFEIPSRYRLERDFAQTAQFSSEFLLAFFPVVLMYAASLRQCFLEKRGEGLWLGLGWTAMSVTAVLLTGKNFYHYWIQVLPPLVWMAAKPETLKWIEKRWPKLSVALLFIACLAVPVHQWVDLNRKEDHVEEIATLIQTDLREDDRIFIDYKNVIYFLCDQQPVNRFVHTTLMHDSAHILAFGINPEAEYRIIRESEPKWMVLYEKGHPLLAEYTNSLYTVSQRYNNGVVVWKRNPEK